MQGMFTWTLHYDATNAMGLDRVMHHYGMVKTNTPDLNLDGKVNATDANTLANNMGMTLTNTGMTTAAQFDAFYMAGNWEKGDHDGNGLVNQADANWLAGRYAALGVNLPDRLAYSGTFESFPNSWGSPGGGPRAAISRANSSKQAISSRRSPIICHGAEAALAHRSTAIIRDDSQPEHHRSRRVD